MNSSSSTLVLLVGALFVTLDVASSSRRSVRAFLWAMTWFVDWLVLCGFQTDLGSFLQAWLVYHVCGFVAEPEAVQFSVRALRIVMISIIAHICAFCLTTTQ